MTIVAAVDFTDASSEVVSLAAAFARKLGSKLVLVHAVEPPFPTTPGGLAIHEDIAPPLDMARGLMARLADATSQPDLELETEVRVGAPDAVVTDLARAGNARLIVVGTHGRGAIGRLFLGSVAQKIVMRAPCATLVTRPHGVAALARWLAGSAALRIVVGVDRTGAATDAALSGARWLQDVGPCDLTLVHEYWPPGEYARFGLRGPRDLFETDPEVVRLLERELEPKVAELGFAPGGRLLVRAAWGAVGDALAQEAENVEAGLVVVGTRQPHGWERARTGSVAISALHAVRAALLCVPVTSDATQPAAAQGLVVPGPLRSILAATDLSELGNQAIAHAYGLLRAAGGTVHLCYVHEHAAPSPSYAHDGRKSQALDRAKRAEIEAQLQLLIPANARELGIQTEVTIVDGGEPAPAIAAAALRVGADAIVVGSRGRSGIRRAVLGSVAEAVIRSAELPVYVARRPS